MLVKIETGGSEGGGGKIYAACGPISNVNGYIECGFKPKKINYGNGNYNPSSPQTIYYDESTSSTTYTRIYGGSYWVEAINSSSPGIKSIDNNGFTINYPQYYQDASAWVVVEG